MELWVGFWGHMCACVCVCGGSLDCVSKSELVCWWQQMQGSVKSNSSWTETEV